VLKRPQRNGIAGTGRLSRLSRGYGKSRTERTLHENGCGIRAQRPFRWTKAILKTPSPTGQRSPRGIFFSANPSEAIVNRGEDMDEDHGEKGDRQVDMEP
jgi:hypothetical protein